MSNRNTLENKRIRKAQRASHALALGGPTRVFSDPRTRERHRYRRDHGLAYSPVVGGMLI
jgi:hypothetical protein